MNDVVINALFSAGGTIIGFFGGYWIANEMRKKEIKMELKKEKFLKFYLPLYQESFKYADGGIHWGSQEAENFVNKISPIDYLANDNIRKYVFTCFKVGRSTGYVESGTEDRDPNDVIFDDNFIKLCDEIKKQTIALANELGYGVYVS